MSRWDGLCSWARAVIAIGHQRRAGRLCDRARHLHYLGHGAGRLWRRPRLAVQVDVQNTPADPMFEFLGAARSGHPMLIIAFAVLALLV